MVSVKVNFVIRKINLAIYYHRIIEMTNVEGLLFVYQ